MIRDSWSIDVSTKRNRKLDKDITKGIMRNVTTGKVWTIGPIPRDQLTETIERIMETTSHDPN